MDDKFYIVKSTRSDHGRAIDTYNADGTKATNSSISVGVAYRNPTGIASLDGDLFVVSTFSGNSYHYSGDKVYAYSATYGHDPSINGFTLHKLDILPIAITSLDDKFYVISAADAKVYVYNTDGTRPLQ